MDAITTQLWWGRPVRAAAAAAALAGHAARTHAAASTRHRRTDDRVLPDIVTLLLAAACHPNTAVGAFDLTSNSNTPATPVPVPLVTAP